MAIDIHDPRSPPELVIRISTVGGAEQMIKDDVTIMQLHQGGTALFPHPRYSPDLAPSNFHTIVSSTNHLGGQKFRYKENFLCWMIVIGVKNMNFNYFFYWCVLFLDNMKFLHYILSKPYERFTSKYQFCTKLSAWLLNTV